MYYIMNIEPYRMNDARAFTDYRANHELNDEIKQVLCKVNNKCCKNNYNYQVCLENSCDVVKKYMEKDHFKNNYSTIN